MADKTVQEQLEKMETQTDPDTTSKPKQETKTEPEEFPDPDEDDLDDLDDVLDDFTAPKPQSSTAKPATASTSAAAPSSSGPGRPPAEPFGANDPLASGLDTLDEDALSKAMASMLSGLDADPAMAAQFNSFLSSMNDAAGAAGAAAEANAAEHRGESDREVQESAREGAKVAEDTFQEQIKKTMERMQASGANADAAAKSGGSEADMFAAMMKEMQAGGVPGMPGMGEGDEDFSKILMSMMEELTKKEMLYEPMKELDEKLPKWITEHEGDKNVKTEDMKKYKEQKELVHEIVARFDRAGYSDDDAGDREYIVERMQKVRYHSRNV